jgi:hypothetical protein
MWITLLARFWPFLVMAALGAAVGIQTHRLHSAQSATIEVQARYDLFIESAKQVVQQQEDKIAKMKVEQEKRDAATKKSADARVAAIAADFDRLRRETGSSNSGDLSRVPDTTRPTDDNSRDQRLLDVLERATLETAKLIELQEWIKGIAK